MTLRELRTQAGKTAKEVADKLGVSVRALYNYEVGTREIGLAHVLILAELYDCTEREIIVGQLRVSNVRCKKEGG